MLENPGDSPQATGIPPAELEVSPLGEAFQLPTARTLFERVKSLAMDLIHLSPFSASTGPINKVAVHASTPEGWRTVTHGDITAVGTVVTGFSPEEVQEAQAEAVDRGVPLETVLEERESKMSTSS